MPKVAVILSGCGHLDGAEIRESVLTLLYLDQQNAVVELFAPDRDQHHVIDHLSGQESSEKRNILRESARIARGKIQPLSAASADDYDALILPGGYGVAKNLSDVAFKGADCKIDQELAALVQSFYRQSKPIGAICIAPAILSAILRQQHIDMTIGEDAATAALIESCGNHHVEAASDAVMVDKSHKIATCSAYMRDDRLADIALGIEKLVKSVLDMCNK